MRTRIPVTIAVGAAAVLLAGCGSSAGSGGGGSTPPSTPAQSTNAAGTTSPPPSTTPPAPPASSRQLSAPHIVAGTPIPVNKSFRDPVLGDKGTVLKYVRNYTPSAAAKKKYSALADEDVVLVDLKVTASSKYYDTLGADSFYLTGTADGIDQASTTILDDDIKIAGYPPLPDADTGKTTTGWVVFTPAKGLKTVTLRYKRLAAKTSSGKTITAKNFDIPLG